MSVAAVQRQLLDSKQTSIVRIGDYLSELGQRLAISLTKDARLSVMANTATVMESNKAVAMGLVVTELVINALRHAFPKNHDGGGRIIIRYKTLGSGWRLSVSDDGIGLSSVPGNGPPAGHGSKIIDALAKELDACIAVRSGSRGTCVSLIHSSECREERKHAGDALMH
jgi:chemotaxis protein methyltransferase CheR